jgi:hypothetical protein
MGSSVLAEPLTKIINQSIRRSEFPTRWKDSKVCHLQKGGQKNSENLQTNVSLLSLPGMVCERVIAIQAEEYFESNKILQEFEFGFRKFTSTISDMLTLFDSLLEANKEGTLVLNYLSTAFDTIDQGI